MNDRNTIVKEIEGRSKIVLLLLNGIEKSGKNQRLLPLAETLRKAPQIKPSKTQPLKKIGYPKNAVLYRTAFFSCSFISFFTAIAAVTVAAISKGTAA